MNIIESLVFDRSQKDALAQTDKFYYNATDLDRVEAAVEYLADILHRYGYSADVTLNQKQIVTRYPFTGNEQIFVVPSDGIYKISAYGASGGKGNAYTKDYGSVGGKGAKITASFELKKDDVIHIIVGEKGTGSTGTTKDGASGGGGGGTFVFKEIPSVTESKWQFAKNNMCFETLLVAAGGGGAWDESYKGSRGDGYDGIGTEYKSPDRFTTRSSLSKSPTASSSTTGALGISQFINYGLEGSFYLRNGSRGQGGYGGGSATDDNRSYGGGWYGASYKTYSWSLDTNAVGEDGANTGNGHASISVDPWGDVDLIRNSEMSRYLNNIQILRKSIAVYSTTPIAPKSADFLKIEHANDMEKILFDVNELITKMESAWFYSGDLYSGEI